MENQTTILKTVAFGGFEKKAVIHYIYELGENAKAAQDKLSAELEELRAARDRLGAALGETEEKLRLLQRESSAQLQSERARGAELTGLVDSLGAEIARQEKIVSDRDLEIARYIAQNRQLEEKNAELEKDRAEVERATAQVGRLILNAQTDAERIVAEARLRADEITRQAQREAEELRSKAGQEALARRELAEREAGELIERARRSAGCVDTQLDALRGELDRMRRVANDAAESMNQKLGELAASINTAQEGLLGTLAEGKAPQLVYSTEEGSGEPVSAGGGPKGDFFR